jgi:hypothetical protein
MSQSASLLANLLCAGRPPGYIYGLPGYGNTVPNTLLSFPMFQLPLFVRARAQAPFPLMYPLIPRSAVLDRLAVDLRP